jgi:hypothetical protein
MADLYNKDGNASAKELLNQLNPQKNLGADKYLQGKKGAKLPNISTTKPGWNK